MTNITAIFHAGPACDVSSVQGSREVRVTKQPIAPVVDAKGRTIVPASTQIMVMAYSVPYDLETHGGWPDRGLHIYADFTEVDWFLFEEEFNPEGPWHDTMTEETAVTA